MGRIFSPLNSKSRAHLPPFLTKSGDAEQMEMSAIRSYVHSANVFSVSSSSLKSPPGLVPPVVLIISSPCTRVVGIDAYLSTVRSKSQQSQPKQLTMFDVHVDVVFHVFV